MAHTAPGTPGAHGTQGAHGIPDLRALSTAGAAPVVLGIVYGIWAAANSRDGGAPTGGNILLGFVAGAAFAVLYTALRRIAPALPRELRAAAWAAFAGIAFGYLYSLGGASVLRSTGMAAVVAASVFAVTFYRYYTRE